MSLLNEYDLRQIRWIERKILLFEKQEASLFTLVCDLAAILNALEFVSYTWKEEFRSEVNLLEVIHDSLEDGSISKWKGNFEEDISKSVSHLRNMTNYFVENYLNIPDPHITQSALEISSSWLICPKCNDAWESHSSQAMVVCPRCECALQNPHFSIKR